MNDFSNEIIFYLGVGITVFSFVSFGMFFYLFKIARKRLETKLKEEYGEVDS